MRFTKLRIVLMSLFFAASASAAVTRCRESGVGEAEGVQPEVAQAIASARGHPARVASRRRTVVYGTRVSSLSIAWTGAASPFIR
jgi:hypothetical protein